MRDSVAVIDRLKAIVREAENTYRVELEGPDGVVRSFIFDVHEGEIQVVSWRRDFAAYMEQNLGPAAPVFEAVLSFHRAVQRGVHRS